MTHPPDTPARNALRLATKSAHERLHENAAFAALLGGNMTGSAYRQLLVNLLGLHQPIEESLGRLPADPLLAWRDAGAGLSRTALLRCDLAALGLGLVEIEQSPRADLLLPKLADAASALGCAWVVEGSALGGRVMSSRVQAILSLGKEAGGGAFFASDLEQPARWRGCCAAVESCGSQANGLAAMTSAATTVFAAFEIWLDPAHQALH